MNMSSIENAVNPHGYTYCPKCGFTLKLDLIDGVSRLHCGSCSFIFYQNPIPAVGAILLQNDEILLVKRKYKPRAGYWSLPAGFVEYSESIQHALLREIKEETNLDIEIGNVFEVFNAFDDSRYHVVVILYYAKIKGGKLKAGDDAMEVGYFQLHDELPELAFSCHTKAIEKLRKISA